MLFTWKAVAGATFLGGPLAAIYLIAHNFNALGKEDEARNTWVFGIPYTIVSFIVLYYLPEEFSDKARFLLPLLFGTLPAWLVMKKYQFPDLESHFEAGGHKGSAWKAAGIALVAAIVYLSAAVGFALAFLDDPTPFVPESYQAVVYMEHSGCPVFYDSKTIIESDAKVAGAALEMIGYFNCRNIETDALFYMVDGEYVISLAVSSESLEIKGNEQLLEVALNKLQQTYNNRKFAFQLVVLNQNGETVREKFVRLD